MRSLPGYSSGSHYKTPAQIAADIKSCLYAGDIDALGKHIESYGEKYLPEDCLFRAAQAGQCGMIRHLVNDRRVDIKAHYTSKDYKMSTKPERNAFSGFMKGKKVYADVKNNNVLTKFIYFNNRLHVTEKNFRSLETLLELGADVNDRCRMNGEHHMRINAIELAMGLLDNVDFHRTTAKDLRVGSNLAVFTTSEEKRMVQKIAALFMSKCQLRLNCNDFYFISKSACENPALFQDNFKPLWDVLLQSQKHVVLFPGLCTTKTISYNWGAWNGGRGVSTTYHDHPDYIDIFSKTVKAMMFNTNMVAVFMSANVDASFDHDQIDDFQFLKDSCENVVAQKNEADGVFHNIDVKNAAVTSSIKNLTEKPLYEYGQDPDNSQPKAYEHVKLITFSYEEPLRKHEKECFSWIWRQERAPRNSGPEPLGSDERNRKRKKTGKSKVIAKLSRRLVKDITTSYTYVEIEWSYNEANKQFKKTRRLNHL